MTSASCSRTTTSTQSTRTASSDWSSWQAWRRTRCERRIFDLYANQQLGIRRISQILFDEGFTSRQGNAFNVLTIRHILCNPKYKGWYCGSKSQTVDYRSKRKVFLDES